MKTLTKAELERYSRHLIIPEFNIEGQNKLKNAKVLIVGCGGLGAPLIQYLAAAGIGHLGILDFDNVDESNLQRQVLFGVDDIGKPKVAAAADRIRQINPNVEVSVYNTRLESSNALDILRGYDLVADGTDNFPTRYLVNDASVILGIPNVYASIFRFEGQASVFNFTYSDGTKGPNYRDLFPTPPPPELVPSCAEGGVIGVLPGILGSIQALEVIKVITGVGTTLAGRLFLIDTASFETRTLQIKARPNTPKITELIDYEAFCAPTILNTGSEKNVASISVHTLKKWREEGKAHQLIDVREPYEYQIAHLEGNLLPLGNIENETDKIRRDVPVVVHCRSGKRSLDAIRLLEGKYGFENLYNLEGGILDWAKYIDESMASY